EPATEGEARERTGLFLTAHGHGPPADPRELPRQHVAVQREAARRSRGHGDLDLVARHEALGQPARIGARARHEEVAREARARLGARHLDLAAPARGLVRADPRALPLARDVDGGRRLRARASRHAGEEGHARQEAPKPDHVRASYPLASFSTSFFDNPWIRVRRPFTFLSEAWSARISFFAFLPFAM